jgi:vancomycin permeability regulator SanA
MSKILNDPKPTKHKQNNIQTDAHPDNPRTPYNEAFQMKQILTRELGIPQGRIIIDSYALHSTTNLRNVARLMLQLGIQNATVVSDW